jgi:hypothetical protein
MTWLSNEHLSCYIRDMMTLSCHCAKIWLTLAKTPDHINACNCALCAKSGARWSYFAIAVPAQLRCHAIAVPGA